VVHDPAEDCMRALIAELSDVEAKEGKPNSVVFSLDSIN